MSAEILKPFGNYRTKGPNEHVIQHLKTFLEEAERGEITGIAIAFLNDHGDSDTISVAGNHGYLALLGAVDVLHDDIMDKLKSNDGSN